MRRGRPEGNPKHGLRWHSAYNCWNGMMQRCHNPNSNSYRIYGGRGILVCRRWRSVKNFVADMGEKPKGETLDRIDNNKGYSPSNCRWATSEEQNNNLRKSVKLKFNGKTLTLAQWSRKLGISRNTIKGRWRRGMSVERILTA